MQKIGWELSMMKLGYKLTIRTTKSENFGKSLKVINIINFKTIRYKVTASGNIIHSNLNYVLMWLPFTAT